MVNRYNVHSLVRHGEPLGCSLSNCVQKLMNFSGQMCKISEWNQLNLGPAGSGTVDLMRADQFLQGLRWNGDWKQLSLGC